MVAHIVTYVMHVSRIQKQFNFDDAGIIAMDETSGMIWFPIPLLMKQLQMKSHEIDWA